MAGQGTDKGPTLMLCDCGRTMSPDANLLSRACGVRCSHVHTELCRSEIDRFTDALDAGGDVVVACGQEMPAFAELAADAGMGDRVRFVDIRDRAGWGRGGKNAQAKMAALVAEALLETPATPAVTLKSEGVALIYGPAEAAIEAAKMVAGRLAVTVMVSDGDDVVLPSVRDFPVVRGRIVAARGYLGKFTITADGFSGIEPSGQGAPAFASPADGMESQCDLIIDLSRGAPLFPAPDKRDGYLRADPRDPAVTMRVLLEASGLVGEFEKPIYISFDASLCAHSRSRQPGCSRCLDVCPTSAITPNGDVVAIDAQVCAGCGACASVCPSAAATYTFPDPARIYSRLEAVFSGWREAGGGTPRLLFHDAAGGEVISLSARFGRGLPGDVIPFAFNEVTQVGHETVLAALAMGAGEVVLLLDPKKAEEAAALVDQVRLANMLCAGIGVSGERARMVESRDPDALEAAFDGEIPSDIAVEPIRPIGQRRSVTRLALGALATASGFDGETIALDAGLFPAGPPYGRIEVDTGACTLCLACVSACPAGALLDSPDRPQLRFHEDACLQCGICRATCPEDAITLEPRYHLGADAGRGVVLHEEEPFACIECGKLFGVRSTVERIAEQLAGKHWMFADDNRARLIRMCDGCRIRAQYHEENSPFRAGARPRVRTADDPGEPAKQNGKDKDGTA